MHIICSDVRTRATVTCPLWFLSVFHLACRSQVTTSDLFSRCLLLWIRTWAPLGSRWINNQLSHNNTHLPTCRITNMVYFSRYISTAALKCAHREKANAVIPAAVAENVSTSILYCTDWQNLWRCCVILNNHLPLHPSTERDVAVTTGAKEPRLVMTVGPLLIGRIEEADQVQLVLT